MLYGDFPTDVSNFLFTLRHSALAADRKPLNFQELQNFPPSLA